VTLRERVFGPGVYYEGGPVPIRVLLATWCAFRLETAAHHLRAWGMKQAPPLGGRRSTVNLKDNDDRRPICSLCRGLVPRHGGAVSCTIRECPQSRASDGLLKGREDLWKPYDSQKRGDS